MVWWFGDESTRNIPCEVDGRYYPSLNRAFMAYGEGETVYQNTWRVIILEPVRFRVGVNSRDIYYPVHGEPHQASEGYGIVYKEIEVNE